MKAFIRFFKTSPRTKGELFAGICGLIMFSALLIVGLISMVQDPKIGWVGTMGPLSMGIIIICAGIALMNPQALKNWVESGNYNDDPKK